MSVTHIGTVHLTSSLILRNVLFVPSFRFNLLYVSTLTNTVNCSITFHAHSYSIQDLSQGEMIGMGNKFGNLYYLSLNLKVPSTCNAVCNVNIVSFSTHELWHYRLGHPSFIKLNVLHEILNIDHLSNTSLHCKIYPLAKQKC